MSERRDFFRIHELKQYKQKRFLNPHKIRDSKDRVPKKLYFLVLALLAFAAFGFFLFAPMFRITSVSVGGDMLFSRTAIENEAFAQLSKKRLLVLPQSNKLFFSNKQLRKEIESVASFDDLQIEVIGHELNIQAEERASELAWITADRMFFTDENGIVIRQASAIEEQAIRAHFGEGIVDGADPAAIPSVFYPIVFDASRSDAKIGTEALSEQIVQKITDLFSALNENSIPVKSFELLTPQTPWIAANLSGGFDSFFSFEEDAKAQVMRLRVILDNNIDESKDLQYVDLRFGEMVYYK
ncbi:MAG: hypothetical protein ACD_76C00105G0010 [uncultured bacterium]|nr:MAG: hypothetical protein ACD_76C00105G0010 [uncultured bacterium]HBD04986.1 hypothetical protein [Candidatus Uhrbacteria bacterium]